MGTPPARTRARRRRLDILGPELTELLDALEQQADELADRMLDRYLQSIPSYRSLPDETLRQVREVNLRNIRGFIEAMREGRGPGPQELLAIRESATRRAREGVPLSALLAAYRSGAQLAWEEARALMGEDVALIRAGLDLATAVMRWVDDASGAAAQAYLAEYERLTSDREGARRDFIDAALAGNLTPDEILARAEALALQSDAPHAIALVGFKTQPEEIELRTAQHRLRQAASELPNAEHSLAVVRGTELVVAFPAGPGDEEKMAVALREVAARATELPELRAGVGRARATLTEMAGSHREATIALSAARAAPAGPVAVYGEVLVEELLLRERSVAQRLARAVLEPLEAHPDLKETLVEYVLHGPSLPAVAKKLYLHPNTVAYRLARVRELTGRDPKTPAGIAELFLALRAAELVGTDPV